MIRRNTWILLAILAVGIGITLYIEKNPKASADGTPTPTAFPKMLTQVSFDSISTLSYTDDQGQTLTLVKNNAVWEVKDSPRQPIDQGKVTQAISSLLSTEQYSQLQPDIDLQTIGLANGKQRITIGDVAGKQTVIQIGQPTATGSGYYLRVDQYAPIVVSNYSLQDVLTLLKPESLLVSTPTPTAAETLPADAPPTSAP